MNVALGLWAATSIGVLFGLFGGRSFWYRKGWSAGVEAAPQIKAKEKEMMLKLYGPKPEVIPPYDPSLIHGHREHWSCTRECHEKYGI